MHAAQRRGVSSLSGTAWIEPRMEQNRDRAAHRMLNDPVSDGYFALCRLHHGRDYNVLIPSLPAAPGTCGCSAGANLEILSSRTAISIRRAGSSSVTLSKSVSSSWCCSRASTTWPCHCWASQPTDDLGYHRQTLGQCGAQIQRGPNILAARAWAPTRDAPAIARKLTPSCTRSAMRSAAPLGRCLSGSGPTVYAIRVYRHRRALMTPYRLTKSSM